MSERHDVRREVPPIADERKRCPKCGADFDHVVCDGEVLQFKCGTLQGRTKTERVIESENCLRRQLARAQERINWLESQWIAIRDMVSCDGDMVDDLIPYVEAVMEDYHAYHTQKRRLEREISQKQAQEQRNVALSSETAAPPAAQERPERAFGKEGRG